MNIDIKKPIVFFDLETTGTDRENDRIVEICMIKVHVDGDKEVRTRRLNPGIYIPIGASDVHGITDDMVKDEPLFAKIAKGVLEFINGSDIAGFNSNAFDIPMLYNEFLRAGIEWDYHDHMFIDVGNIFKRLYPRTLEAAVKKFLKREHDGAHGAESDTNATMEVFEALMSIHGSDEELPKDIDGLNYYSNYDKPILDISGKFTLDDDGETIIFNFGKHRGEPAKDYPSFLNWMVTRANFSPDTNKIALQILKDYD